MAYNVRFTPNALDDLFAIVDYIARDNEARGLAFVEELRQRIEDKLSVFPESGTATDRFRFTVFSRYVVVYIIDPAPECVTVILVTEGHRDWQRLLETRS